MQNKFIFYINIIQKNLFYRIVLLFQKIFQGDCDRPFNSSLMIIKSF